MVAPSSDESRFVKIENLADLSHQTESIITDKIAHTAQRMMRTGYRLLGYSSLNSSSNPEFAKLEAHAQQIGADVVVYYTRHKESVHKQVPVTLSSPGLGETIRVRSETNGVVTKSQITMPKTYIISHTEHRYYHSAMFWKRITKKER